MERFKYLVIEPDNESDKPLQEKCGLVAIYNPCYAEQLPLTLLAGYGVQHRGQLGAGVSLTTENGLKVFSGNGLLSDIFTPSIINSVNEPSKIALLHCRYGTEGGYGDVNLQPCVAESPLGEKVAVIHNGQFVAIEDLRSKIKHKTPDDASDTYLFTQLLSQIDGNTWDEKVLNALDQVNGAYSLAIAVKDSLFVARDQFGIRPFVMGQKGQSWIFASEDHALSKIGVPAVREVKRGEVLKLNNDGVRQLRPGLDGPGNFCDFEFPYFAHPASTMPIHERSDNAKRLERRLAIFSFRERSGQLLAKEAPIPNASFVVGVPDSGVPLALGYAIASNTPYRQAIIRDHYDPNGTLRLFQTDKEKQTIANRVLGKLSLIPDSEIWKDASVVVGDDSIVRSFVSKQITNAIKSFGAKEVHWVVGFPPVSFPCHLGVSMRTREELIAARHNADPERIAEEIGANSVNYISNEGFVRSKRPSGDIVIPKNQKEIFLANDGCGGCITGIYPISKEGIIYQRDSS